jgi:cell division septation protein DedD
MSDSQEKGGRTAFFGLAMLIFGGLLFAAGVMVGRQLTLGEKKTQISPLQALEKRDKPPENQDFQFPALLGQMEKKQKPQMITPVSPAVPTPTPAPAPTPPTVSPKKDSIDAAGVQGGEPQVRPATSEKEAAAVSYAVQVAAYRERAQAQELLQKLSSRGYKDVRVLESEGDDKGKFFRVRAGKLKERTLAEELGRKIVSEEKLKGMIVTER